jgi:mannobiose 2-epimerase
VRSVIPLQCFFGTASRAARAAVVLLLAWSCAPAALEAAPGDDLGSHAQRLKSQLRNQIMPYWFDTTVDRDRGGYLLADDLNGRGQASEKQLVTQTRMLWSFSHVHRRGLRDPQRDYLHAATQGYNFIVDHFLDRQHGGYFWKTDLDGKPTVERKILYGEAFVVYAFVEYYRASGDTSALRHALDLYGTIQRRAHDARNGGWYEHFERDWRPILTNDSRVEVEVGGLKSANAHLHWMEALAELYEASLNSDVRVSLAEALRLNQRYFYPIEPGKSCFHRTPNWSPVTAPSSAGLSYGHNVEFAWLMLRAEEVLGRPSSWDHFHAHVRHALEFGYDHARGGLYSRGVDDLPATDTNKVWWVQAEMIAALTDGLQHRGDPEYQAALTKLLEFVAKYQADPRDGIWLDTVTAEGKPKSTGKAHSWKGAYHDGRAILKFIEAFGEKPAPPPKPARKDRTAPPKAARGT